MEDKIKELEEKLLCKEQECEELKSELELYKTWYRAKHGDVKNILKRYHKALEEIEKYCSNAQDPCQDDWNRERENFAKIILNFISKVKGGNNE